MKRWSILVASLLLVTVAACQAPPVRTSTYRRVLVIGDSFVNGGSFLEYPSLAGSLGPDLAPDGIELRVIGAAGQLPGRDQWVTQVHRQVVAWDPDLVIVESVIPDDSSGPGRIGLVTNWAQVMVAAAARGADVWRIVPPHPVPGSFIDVLYSSHRADLLSAQSDGMRVGATNRPPRPVDLDATIAGCPGAWTWDGGHMTQAGQDCVAAGLFALIAHHPLPAPPTTTPPDTTPPVTDDPTTVPTTTTTTSVPASTTTTSTVPTSTTTTTSI